MNEDLRYMFRKVILFDTILAIILSIINYFLFKKYMVLFLMGLLIAIFSFLINGLLTEYAFTKKKENHTLVTLVGFVMRVALVCAIGITIYKNNEFNIVAFMLGYSFHFISITLYGIKINK